jgi:hypothetical protein
MICISASLKVWATGLITYGTARKLRDECLHVTEPGHRALCIRAIRQNRGDLPELLGARVRNPNTRSAYRVTWRSFLAFCSARQLELGSVKAYHVGAWLNQHPGSRSTQRQHLAAVRLLFDSLMMRGAVEYNAAARARPPRLVRESSHTPVFEEAEIVALLDSINLASLKDIRDKAIFSILFYSWCRVSALINLTVADYYERGGTRWLRFQEKRGKEHEVPVHSKAKEAVNLWLECASLASMYPPRSYPLCLPTWVIGLALTEGQVIDHPGDVLKVWPRGIRSKTVGAGAIQSAPRLSLSPSIAVNAVGDCVTAEMGTSTLPQPMTTADYVTDAGSCLRKTIFAGDDACDCYR